MATEFGKQVRKYRIDQDVSLRDMAAALGVSAAYLSAVETGKKNVTEDLVRKVCEYFGLDAEQERELRHLAEMSRKELVIPLDGMPPAQRNSAVMFARRLTQLSPDELEKLNQLLEGG